MNFFNPSVTFKGTVSCDNAPSANSDLTRKQDIAGLSYISSIAAGSSSMLSVDGSGALSIDSLAITDVHVDSSQTSLANFISNESSTAASLKEGDVLILTNATGGTETWIVSGANGSSAGNYTKIESSLTAAEVGAVLQAGDGITVNAGNATISANIAAGSGLSSSVSGGQITFALNANSDLVSEGSSNLYFTQARSRSSLSVASVSSPEVQLLTYNSGTGALSVPLSSVFSEFSAGTGLSYADGEYALNATTSNVAEGANLYYTDARVRAAISAGSQSDELINYNSSNGSFSLRENQLRFDTQQTLSGGVGLQITHNLGKKLVHVSAMDSSGNLIQLDVVYNSTSQLTVTSQVGITADIAISI